MEKTDSQIGIRLTRELKDRIEAQADSEHRTVSNFVLKVVIEYLEQAEKEAKLPK